MCLGSSSLRSLPPSHMQWLTPIYRNIFTLTNELCAVLSYPAQFNIMLKYKNVKFLQHFAQKVRAFAHFCQLSDTFLQLFAHFFSCPFYPNSPCCQPTSIYRPKTNTRTRRTKKNCNFPPFFKFSKISFLNHVNLRNPQNRHSNR